MGNSSRIAVTLTNFKEFRQLLKALPPSVEARVMSDAVGVALKPIQRLARTLAPKRTGALRKSIAVLVKRYPKDGKIVGLVGPDNDYYASGKRVKPGGNRRGADRPAKYAHLVEFGHYSGASSAKFGGLEKGTSIRKGTATPKTFVLAQPFMRPAVQMGAPQAIADLEKGVEVGIKREAGRLASKLKRIRKG